MAEISATLVKELRDMTGAPMMDSKRALQETNGDIEAAVRVLREKGMAGAAKRAEQPIDLGPGELADRASGVDLCSPQHLIGQEVANTGNGVLIEQSRLHRRCAAAGHYRSELSRGDAGRIRTESLDRRIEPNPGESPRIDEHQRTTVGEG